MSKERPEIDMKEFLEQKAKRGMPLIVIEPESSSEDLVRKLRSVLPDAKKHHVQIFKLGSTQ